MYTIPRSLGGYFVDRMQNEGVGAARTACLFFGRAPFSGFRMHVLHTFANNSHVPYLSWFAERAAREGNIRYTFLIMYPEPPAMIEEMERLGFPCIWIPFDARSRKLGMLRALPLLWKHIRKARPDIVHCNLFDDTVPGLLAAWLARVRIRVITRQDTAFHWAYAPQWVWLDRWNSRLATHVITISGESRKFLLEKEGTPPQKLSLVHNGIPPERYTLQDTAVMERLKDRFGIRGRSPVFGTVARFIAWKGYRHLVDAAREFIRDQPDAVFLFCGSGEQEPEVRRWVAEAGLQHHVVFTGWVERSEMASFLGLLDAYLHAAELEPFGLVYAEAMMNAVPVVSTRTGAALDAIEDGRNGILADRNGNALAEGIRRLFKADRKAIGLAGRETALRMYPFDVMWRGTTGLYERALKELP